ncbi:MAG TPA: hypothetical protein VHW00_10115 [Thermoanaerobaculia bacterium]|nr:hypothetical protein [Thermoanaerobaculia bacterium]
MKRIAIALVVFFVAGSAAAKNLYIPVAGSSPGANGTRFRTDVRIFNPSSTTAIGISIHFLPQNMDGSNIPGRVVTIEPRQVAVLNDIVANFLQWPVPAIGAIRLDSDTDKSYEFSAESRTYTDSPNPNAPGTYGQFIPALDPEVDAIKTGIVTHVISTAAFRTNAGVMNANRESVGVRVVVMKTDGTVAAESAQFSVPAMSMTLQSLAQLTGLNSELTDGYLVIESTHPVFPFASIIDNQSNDSIFVPGVADIIEINP